MMFLATASEEDASPQASDCLSVASHLVHGLYGGPLDLTLNRPAQLAWLFLSSSPPLAPGMRNCFHAVPTVQPNCGTLLMGIDLSRGDLAGGGHVGVASVGACCSLCHKSSSCFAFTYHAANQACYLKAAKGWSALASPSCTSAMMVKGVCPLKMPDFLTSDSPLLESVYWPAIFDGHAS